MIWSVNLNYMVISGWNKKYNEILKEFGYSKKDDTESARILNSKMTKKITSKTLTKLIQNNDVFIIGAGPSLLKSINILKKFSSGVKIVADGAIQVLLENNLKADILVTDLDGDLKSIKKIGKTDTLIFVHAHGDNIDKLNLVSGFKNWTGTTQTKEFGKLYNFGGFTDGDRCVFLANYFNAKNIILVGMDFGNTIGKYSKNISNKTLKRKKLRFGKELLEWVSLKSKSNLYTTSRPINGFKKISFSDLEQILNY